MTIPPREYRLARWYAGSLTASAASALASQICRFGGLDELARVSADYPFDFSRIVKSAARAVNGPAPLTHVSILAESHLVVSTYPERGLVRIDLVSCRPVKASAVHRAAITNGLRPPGK